MPRANLSTRPFYNERPVRAVLGLVAAAVIALTVFNAVQVLRLRSRGAEVQGQAEAAERDAAGLRTEAAQTRRTINREQLAAVQTAALEANQLIDRRAFSWTDLFNRFERTLPPEVRIASVTPQVDQAGRFLVAVTVVSRRVEDLDGFIDALEQTGAFREVLSRQEEAQDDGTLRSVIQGYYQTVPTTPSQASGEPAAPADGPVTARAEAPR
ncbi:MAG TPA: hypothetical protein PLH72_10775 [Vicinamibacterales bacterium]|nr:hypothetical protein [Vicinamibacterales bacterium]